MVSVVEWNYKRLFLKSLTEEMKFKLNFICLPVMIPSSMIYNKFDPKENANLQ
jgi:hypothetical protein